MIDSHVTDALEAADGVVLVPLALAHVRLGVVQAERLDMDEDLARDGEGLQEAFMLEDLGAAEADNDDSVYSVSRVRPLYRAIAY